MGVGEAVFYASLILAAVTVLVVVGALRISARRPRDLSDTIAEQIAAAETDYYTELRAAPIIGVPYDSVRSDGSHDLYPHMSDAARDVCIGYLESLMAMPARERAQ
jgi:hypothetical protein